jgi:hypothetical protein
MRIERYYVCVCVLSVRVICEMKLSCLNICDLLVIHCLRFVCLLSYSLKDLLPFEKGIANSNYEIVRI